MAVPVVAETRLHWYEPGTKTTEGTDLGFFPLAVVRVEPRGNCSGILR